MSALNQYLDIYREHRDMIVAGSSDVMNCLREKAFNSLSEAVLPAVGSENYEHTDLEKLLAPDYGLNLGRLKIDVNPAHSFKCDVPNLSTSLFFLINDNPAETVNSRNMIPEGVIVGSISRMFEKYPDIFRRYYGSIADMANSLVALNTMLAQDGFCLIVPKGVRLERPIQLVNIFRSENPLMACRRVLVVMEEDSEAQLLVCDHTQNSDVDFLSLQTVEIIAGAGSRFSYYDLEESSQRTTRLSSLYLRQDKDSDVLVDGITLYNGVTRNEYNMCFVEDGARLKLLGMAIEDLSRRLDTYSLIRHSARNCVSDEMFRYVADDDAVAAFTGLILVDKGATGTDARQSSRNILSSDTARIFTKPQLEIYNDDVRCSHGASVGQLDPMQVFYMRTRGLSEDVARTLLKQAFMADIVDAVRLPSLSDRLRHLVERRFAGGDAGCASCASAGCTEVSGII